MCTSELVALVAFVPASKYYPAYESGTFNRDEKKREDERKRTDTNIHTHTHKFRV